MSAKQQLGIETIRNYWCHSARPLRLLGMNGMIVVPILAFMLHIRVWTFSLLVLTAILMTLAERRGYSPAVAMLAIRSKLAGRRVKAARRTGRRRIWAR